MLESDTTTLLGRITELEKKVSAQSDEIIWLKNNLADAVRRISSLEIHEHHDMNTGLKHQKISLPLSKNGRNFCKSKKSVASIKITQSDHRDVTAHNLIIQSRPLYYSATPQFHQRKVVQYQSTNSLHSDSLSSNSSMSPVHSPRATPLPSARLQISRLSSLPQSSLNRAKRWSSTGDFTNSVSFQGGNVPLPISARLSTSSKSLLNLTKRPSPNVSKNSDREIQYNKEAGLVSIAFHTRQINVCVPPSAHASYDFHKVSTPPQSNLKLDWVYGYRGRDCRNNLYFLPTGEIIYFVASVVVLYNTEEHSQRHYRGHRGNIKCISIHPNKLIVASGQASGIDVAAHIRIWNSVNLSTLCTVGNSDFNTSICCLCFSKADGGSFLAVVDESPDHNISIWDWQKSDKGTKITEVKCATGTVICAEWHPLERNQIVTCGKGHVSFWSIDNGVMLYKRMGLFESREKPRYVTCIAFGQNGNVLTGDSNGNIIVWTKGTNTISRFIKHLHEGSVFSIYISKDDYIITGGGKDGRIVLLDNSLISTGIEIQIENHFGGIRTIVEGKNSQLFIGTTRNCILVGNFKMGFRPAMLGHSEEICGTAVHPLIPQFASAGYDRLLQMWDSLSHTVVWSKDIGEQAQCLCFSPDGSIIIVGCVSGKWLAIDSETRQLYSYHSDGPDPIQVIRFSPDGTLLAVGSRDSNIYIYQVGENAIKYSRIGRCMGHTNYVTHLDWSLQGQYLRSNSKNYELIFWNAGVCRQISPNLISKDVDWATHTCVVSFETIGIWSDLADGFDINDCTRSEDKNLLAVGDAIGNVKLFYYPACQPKAIHHTYNGHSKDVKNVAFLQDNARLISNGGADTSILQWIVSELID